MALQRTGNDYVTPSGVHYALYRDTSTGQIFTYDPNRELSGPHINPLKGSSTLSGLGISAESAGIDAAATAANFIPGVGPIVSAVISLAGGLFGGGDPTPLSQLITNIVNLRAQIAQAHQALGIPDSFTVPAGFNAQDKATWASLVEGIVSQATGKPISDVESSNRRKDYYAAISAMQSSLQQLQTQAEIQTAVAAATSQTAPPTTANVLPASQPVQLPANLPTASTPIQVLPDNAVNDAAGINPLMLENLYAGQTPSTPTLDISAPAFDPLWIIVGGVGILAVALFASRQ